MTAAPSPNQPLEGLRVLDLTTVIMGPYATSLLADLGADVIKVEDAAGDMARTIGARRHDGMTGIMLNLHRNKRSVSLDLKSDAGREAFLGLVRTADAVVTNLRPAARERLGLTYEDLAEVKPDIVLCTAQAYRTGDVRENAPAYDDIVQAASGIPTLFERATGRQLFAPFVLADKVCGLMMAHNIVAALLQQQRAGVGCWVDVPMVDTMVSFNLVEHLNAHTFVPPLRDFGWHRVLVDNRHPQRTADGTACILPYSSQNWRDVFEFIGRSDLVDDPRYVTVDDRHTNMADLLALLDEHAGRYTTTQWADFCERHSVPFSPVVDLEHPEQNPYLTEGGPVSVQEHPTEGAYVSVGAPARFGAQAPVLRRHAPLLGEHTHEVLREAGLSPEQISAALSLVRQREPS